MGSERAVLLRFLFCRFSPLFLPRVSSPAFSPLLQPFLFLLPSKPSTSPSEPKQLRRLLGHHGHDGRLQAGRHGVRGDRVHALQARDRVLPGPGQGPCPFSFSFFFFSFRVFFSFARARVGKRRGTRFSLLPFFPALFLFPLALFSDQCSIHPREGEREKAFSRETKARVEMENSFFRVGRENSALPTPFFNPVLNPYQTLHLNFKKSHN